MVRKRIKSVKLFEHICLPKESELTLEQPIR